MPFTSTIAGKHSSINWSDFNIAAFQGIRWPQWREMGKFKYYHYLQNLPVKFPSFEGTVYGISRHLR